MKEKRHEAGGIRSLARYSQCGRYRYLLARRWGGAGSLAFVMLNPSTATEVQNDATIERCQRRAVMLGFGGMDIVNLFAWRATRPADLMAVGAPMGEHNDSQLLEVCTQAEQIICGWGMHGTHHGRGDAVAAMLRGAGLQLYHLGLTTKGAPRHPLYVAYAQKPVPWQQGLVK